ncbi:hypothetical protein Xcel_0876 [Xylanimonas cellulosilytica DSM 15894]|uniref:Uncharacterized protein n=1 Tax=Xylanimonas cellulosilytica (strain DSM 15894 / JCM 12276 / CECT 5975 / KCTC 9989 / LMG 20990 / NBRC 107835 / XIL07) TaxID=446471 RepID=D1BY65_XYLCX|nr:DUF6226 family protein [Xylanimonas cellulosilytica]ACZ29908.1 hypothetical protein Xcel_0876 [Xylanimonas cellulosilytica DSM 15894]
MPPVDAGVPFPRPALPEEPWFVDADGARFRYGTAHFEEDGRPVDAAYSRSSHPERFAPLHEVADRLVEWLVSAYDVGIAEIDAADVAEQAPADAVRAVRLTPSDPDAAPLIVLWTAYPGVMVFAGTMLWTAVPHCGCDACDETATRSADELESTVTAVVRGGLTEWLRHPPPAAQALIGERGRGEPPGPGRLLVDGSGWSCGSVAEPWAGLDAAKDVLGRLPGGRWRPWPVRPRTGAQPG